MGWWHFFLWISTFEFFLKMIVSPSFSWEVIAWCSSFSSWESTSCCANVSNTMFALTYIFPLFDKSLSMILCSWTLYNSSSFSAARSFTSWIHLEFLLIWVYVLTSWDFILSLPFVLSDLLMDAHDAPSPMFILAINYLGYFPFTRLSVLNPQRMSS